MYGGNKKRRPCRSPSGFHNMSTVGIILIIFGATTLCAFLLPVKAWIFLLGIVLLLCGILLIYK